MYLNGIVVEVSGSVCDGLHFRRHPAAVVQYNISLEFQIVVEACIDMHALGFVTYEFQYMHVEFGCIADAGTNAQRPRKAAFCHDSTITVIVNPYIVILLTVF